MSRRACASLACLWIAALAAPAFALNPDTDSRADDISTRTGVSRVCEGGPNDGDPCTSSADCLEPAGLCTGIPNINVVARGEITIIADTMLFEDPADPQNPWDEVAPTPLPNPLPCSTPSTAVPSDCETQNRSTLTLLLEFERNGKRYSYAEIFKQLPFAFTIVPENSEGWSQPAVESTLSERTAFSDGVRIRWGILSPAAEAKLRALLGGSPTQRVVLSRVDEVPICTDPTPCQHGPRNDRFQDQSGPADVLATVRRYKVDIALVPGN